MLLSNREPSPKLSCAALAGLRILVGLLWLYNVVWKTPPDFGQDSDGGLYGFTRDAVEHPVLPPFSWVVEHLVLPHFLVFAWATLVVETLLAVLLLTGTLVRVAALVGIGQGLAIGLSIARSPGEWPWAYIMLIGIHIVLLFTWSTRYFALDDVLTRKGRGGPAAAALLRAWGIVLGVVGVIALIVSFQTEPMAPLGGLVGIRDLEVTLGNYNLAGALVLLAVAASALGSALLRRREIAFASSALAAAAALTIYLQSGRADVWLGGTNSTAALLLCAAVVCGGAGWRLGHSAPRIHTHH